MSRSAPTHAPDATVRPDAALRRLAHRRVALTTGWCVHALVYLLVNAGLWAGAAVADAGRSPWSPLWGWGLGLGVHGTVTLALLVAGGLHARGLSRAMGGLRR